MGNALDVGSAHLLLLSSCCPVVRGEVVMVTVVLSSSFLSPPHSSFIPFSITSLHLLLLLLFSILPPTLSRSLLTESSQPTHFRSSSSLLPLPIFHLPFFPHARPISAYYFFKTWCEPTAARRVQQDIKKTGCSLFNFQKLWEMTQWCWVKDMHC